MTAGNLLSNLGKRNLIADQTPGLAEALSPDALPLTLYLGIDPTSDSLHLGSFLGIIMLERFRLAGHRPLALVGGATGMIGDPSGKSDERNLLSAEALQHNFESVKSQIQSLTEIPDKDFLDNRQWLTDIGMLDFLRNVGKHATINQMVAKESIKARMQSTDGISFTEFSYMLLQAYDFYWLNANVECSLQVGGSDQWGNITAGVDLIRRISRQQAHGMTWPLVKKADGSKFGKTAEGTVWLDQNRTSAFALYQYLLNLDDETAIQLLYWMTLDSVEELEGIVKSHRQKPESRRAQEHLAFWTTSYVHGEKAAAAAKSSAQVIFAGELPTAEQLEALQGEMPETSISKSELEGEEALVALLLKTELCSSKSDARRQLQQGAISVNGETMKSAILNEVQPLGGRFLLLGRGKKKRHLLVLE